MHICCVLRIELINKLNELVKIVLINQVPIVGCPMLIDGFLLAAGSIETSNILELTYNAVIILNYLMHETFVQKTESFHVIGI